MIPETDIRTIRHRLTSPSRIFAKYLAGINKIKLAETKMRIYRD